MPKDRRVSRTRATPAADTDSLRSLAVRAGVTAGATAGGHLLDRVTRRRSPSLLSLLRAAAAGGVAALLVAGIRPLLGSDGTAGNGRARTDGAGDDPETDLPDLLLGGVGRGLVYGALVHPHLPGPPLLRGALFGTAEFVLAPVGGASRLLQPVAPWRKVPGLGPLLDPGEAPDTPFVNHLLFGAALGVLYGRGPGRDRARKGSSKE